MKIFYISTEFLIFFSSLNHNRFEQATQNKTHYSIELAEKKKYEAATNEKADYDPYLNRKVEHPTTYV